VTFAPDVAIGGAMHGATHVAIRGVIRGATIDPATPALT
jgi:hypothetical protein